jgi:lipopolysaccharide transport system permease protein
MIKEKNITFWRRVINNITQHQYLIRLLLGIKLTAEFKKSILSWGWLVIIPLVSLLVWIIVKQGGIINPGELAVPYPAFVFLSITMWALFFEIYKRTGNTILENTNLMLANKIPFEVFILNNILEGIIRVSISFLLCIFLFLFL